MNRSVRISGRELAVAVVVLFALLVCANPGVFFRGEVVGPGDFANRLSPWDNGTPDVLREPTSSPLFDWFSYFYPNYIMARVEGNQGIAQYEVTGRRYLEQLSGDLPSYWVPLAAFGDLSVYRNTRVLPRAFLVPRDEVVQDREHILEEYSESEFVPGQTALIERPLAKELRGGDASDIGEAAVIERFGTRTTVAASASRDGILVVLDAFYPGWEARVDGEPTEVFPVYHAFRGIVLPEGEHTVEFQYDPASFKWGLAFSSVSLCVSLLASLYLLWRGKAG